MGGPFLVVKTRVCSFGGDVAGAALLDWTVGIILPTSRNRCFPCQEARGSGLPFAEAVRAGRFLFRASEVVAEQAQAVATNRRNIRQGIADAYALSADRGQTE